LRRNSANLLEQGFSERRGLIRRPESLRNTPQSTNSCRAIGILADEFSQPRKNFRLTTAN
jgi:hypothetical protein